VAGAYSVARYLDNSAADRLLAVLPLSFDCGFSQLTTAFARGAAVVLMNHLRLRDGKAPPRCATSPVRAERSPAPRLPPCATRCRTPAST
jgi:hypothetical protein